MGFLNPFWDLTFKIHLWMQNDATTKVASTGKSDLRKKSNLINYTMIKIPKFSKKKRLFLALLRLAYNRKLRVFLTIKIDLFLIKKKIRKGHFTKF
ncbi:hypothetical protein BpHYR1_037777 [Brachionus plicatilis]|uniref:Uncharacterized protein n=1 Tax=Brachionus plicatilis TaxID=10195 RepID=A0A3M7T3V9_BRAPC|nr:hypothetical protein BpHYR1_037777 [Brachionus plicatilis]